MKGVVISGGTPCDSDILLKCISADTTVVCADSGYLQAKELGIKPAVVIGDFDSMSSDEVTGNVEILKHKVEKDETDTQLCIDFLADKGINEIYIFGALGGNRFEHTYANLKLLEYGFEKGVHIIVKNEKSEIFLVTENVVIKGDIGDHISVFTLHGASGIFYKGLKYPMHNGKMKSSDIIGVSNSMIEKEAEISVEKGQLIIIHTGK